MDNTSTAPRFTAAERDLALRVLEFLEYNPQGWYSTGVIAAEFGLFVRNEVLVATLEKLRLRRLIQRNTQHDHWRFHIRGVLLRYHRYRDRAIEAVQPLVAGVPASQRAAVITALERVEAALVAELALTEQTLGEGLAPVVRMRHLHAVGSALPHTA